MGYNPVLHLKVDFVVLEPDAVKVASPVLRGGWFSNELSLPYPCCTPSDAGGSCPIQKECPCVITKSFC